MLHEMLHVAVESQSNPKTPKWFREGLVLYLAGAPILPASGSGAEQIMRREYQSALARVRTMVERQGIGETMKRLRTGDPQ